MQQFIRKTNLPENLFEQSSVLAQFSNYILHFNLLFNQHVAQDIWEE